MLHALNYFIKCVKHVAIINNSWQEPQALEIQTSLPYLGVKLSCVCLMFAYRKNSLSYSYPNVTYSRLKIHTSHYLHLPHLLYIWPFVG